MVRHTAVLSQRTKISAQQVILLIQRILILLGSASHSITQERQRVTWACMNPTSLPPVKDTEQKAKETILFHGDFLEKATKQMEQEKVLAKVAGEKHKQSGNKCRQTDRDPNDLRHFLEKGAPTKYGGGNQMHSKTFHHSKLYNHPKPAKLYPGNRGKRLTMIPETVDTHIYTGTNFQLSLLLPFPSGSPAILPTQLTNYNSQPMGIGSCQGLLTSALVQVMPPRAIGFKRAHLISEKAHKLLANGALVLPRSVSQQDLCGYEEGWLTQASDQTDATEPIHEEHTLQDGKPGYDEGLTETRRLALIDLKDAYLLVAVWEGHQKCLRCMWQDTMYKF